MAFTLIIEFQGLCLFVRDEQDQVMHVLLPDAGGHDAAFHFDPRHDAGGNPARTREAFHGLRWNLGTIVSGGADLTLPQEVVDVAQFVRPTGIPRSQLIPGGQVAVKSHLVLPAGRYLCHGDVPRFQIGRNPDVRAASMLRWIVDIPNANQLTWEFHNLDGTPANTPVALTPVSNVIRLFVLHAPPGLALPICRAGDPNHFPMYYPLFLAGSGTTPVVCTGDVDDGTCTNAVDMGRAAAAEAANAGPLAPNVFTCMLGQTTIDPQT
jgi:hypothetical protein